MLCFIFKWRCRESIKESRPDQGQRVTPGHDPCLQLPATLRSQSGDQLTELTTTCNTNNKKHNKHNTTKTISNDETHATPTHDNERREKNSIQSSKKPAHTRSRSLPPLDQHPAGRQAHQGSSSPLLFTQIS